MTRLVRKFTPKEGMVVDYKGSPYWICELRPNDRVRLLPMEAVCFDDGYEYDLSRAFEVDLKKIKPYEAG